VHHQRGTIAKIETFFENYKKFVKFFMKWPFGCMKLDQITIFESESQKNQQGTGKDLARCRQGLPKELASSSKLFELAYSLRSTWEGLWKYGFS